MGGAKLAASFWCTRNPDGSYVGTETLACCNNCNGKPMAASCLPTIRAEGRIYRTQPCNWCTIGPPIPLCAYAGIPIHLYQLPGDYRYRAFRADKARGYFAPAEAIRIRPRARSASPSSSTHRRPMSPLPMHKPRVWDSLSLPQAVRSVSGGAGALDRIYAPQPRFVIPQIRISPPESHASSVTGLDSPPTETILESPESPDSDSSGSNKSVFHMIPDDNMLLEGDTDVTMEEEETPASPVFIHTEEVPEEDSPVPTPPASVRRSSLSTTTTPPGSPSKQTLLDNMIHVHDKVMELRTENVSLQLEVATLQSHNEALKNQNETLQQSLDAIMTAGPSTGTGHAHSLEVVALKNLNSSLSDEVHRLNAKITAMSLVQEKTMEGCRKILEWA